MFAVFILFYFKPLRHFLKKIYAAIEIIAPFF